MTNRLNTIDELIGLFGKEVFQLKNIYEGIVQYKNCVPIQYEETLYTIEVELFYENGNCLNFDTFIDILRETPKVHSVDIYEISSNNRINIYRKTIKDY